VLCSRIALFQLAKFFLESRELRLFARNAALCIVKGLGKGYPCSIEAIQVFRVLLGRRHAGRTCRGCAGGIEDTCEG
jgi:hypothetical protein